MQNRPPPTTATAPRADADTEPTAKRAKPPAPHGGLLSMLAGAQHEPVRFTTTSSTAAERAALDAPRPALEVGLCGLCAEVGGKTPATEILPHCGHTGMCADCKEQWAEAWETPEAQATMSLDVCPVCRADELRTGRRGVMQIGAGPSFAAHAPMDQGHDLERSSLPAAAAPP